MKFKEITLQKILDKIQKRDSKIKLNNDIAKKLTESNNEYQMFENKINFNYSNLSKYSQVSSPYARFGYHDSTLLSKLYQTNTWLPYFQKSIEFWLFCQKGLRLCIIQSQYE